MAVTLTVNGPAWRAQIAAVRQAQPNLIPVAKGNGYGQGLIRLAEVSQSVGFDQLAVGTMAEANLVAPVFGGTILVLTPWHPAVPDDAPGAGLAERLVRTVSSAAAIEQIEAMAASGFVLEIATSLRRFGLRSAELRSSLPGLKRQPLALSVHLPLTGNDCEAITLAKAAAQTGLAVPEIQVSHLSPAACERLNQATGLKVAARIGTELWIGDGSALMVTGTVRAVWPVKWRARVGYRQARVPAPGHIVVVDGGTAHGIGLTAPRLGASMLSRLRSFGGDFLVASEIVRSPFFLDGHRLRYADSPHAQVALLHLPRGQQVPEIGRDVAINVRHTTLLADRIVQNPT